MADADTIFTPLALTAWDPRWPAGDVNGDGFADILFAQYGKVFVVLGNASIQAERHGRFRFDNSVHNGPQQYVVLLPEM